jgi:RES domain
MSARGGDVPHLLTVTRGGEYVRVADPSWKDPLSGDYARRAGGRWNPPGGFAVVYLNGDVRVARANVLARFSGLPYGPEDLEPSAAPVLVSADVEPDDFADLISDAGCVAAGLPATYPHDAAGKTVPHDACRAVGRATWDAGLPGIACRSAAPAAPADGEELARFPRGRLLAVLSVRRFADWF